MLGVRCLMRAAIPIIVIVLTASLPGAALHVQAAPAGDPAANGHPGQFDPTLSLEEVLAKFDDRQ